MSAGEGQVQSVTEDSGSRVTDENDVVSASEIETESPVVPAPVAEPEVQVQPPQTKKPADIESQGPAAQPESNKRLMFVAILAFVLLFGGLFVYKSRDKKAAEALTNEPVKKQEPVESVKKESEKKVPAKDANQKTPEKVNKELENPFGSTDSPVTTKPLGTVKIPFSKYPLVKKLLALLTFDNILLTICLSACLVFTIILAIDPDTIFTDAVRHSLGMDPTALTLKMLRESESKWKNAEIKSADLKDVSELLSAGKQGGRSRNLELLELKSWELDNEIQENKIQINSQNTLFKQEVDQRQKKYNEMTKETKETESYSFINYAKMLLPLIIIVGVVIAFKFNKIAATGIALIGSVSWVLLLVYA